MKAAQEGLKAMLTERRILGLFEGFILKSRYILVPLFSALVFEILTITTDFVRILAGGDCERALVAHTMQALELVTYSYVNTLDKHETD